MAVKRDSFLPARRRAARAVILCLASALVLAACASPQPQSVRSDPPPAGEPADIGTAYGLVLHCPIPFELGGVWWAFDDPAAPWPPPLPGPPFPFSLFHSVGSPHDVPGTFVLRDPDTAVFRADVDGSQFDLSASEENPDPGTACL